jgi:hypothetical protein
MTQKESAVVTQRLSVWSLTVGTITSQLILS